MFELTGFGGFVILALDIWALISVINSAASTARKVIWALLVIMLPLLGFILWLLAGPKSTGR